MKGNLIALASGVLFAIGGMTQPAKVIGFLDFTGACGQHRSMEAAMCV